MTLLDFESLIPPTSSLKQFWIKPNQTYGSYMNCRLLFLLHFISSWEFTVSRLRLQIISLKPLSFNFKQVWPWWRKQRQFAKRYLWTPISYGWSHNKTPLMLNCWNLNAEIEQLATTVTYLSFTREVPGSNPIPYFPSWDRRCVFAEPYLR
jgi:hypothetical protein